MTSVTSMHRWPVAEIERLLLGLVAKLYLRVCFLGNMRPLCAALLFVLVTTRAGWAAIDTVEIGLDKSFAGAAPASLTKPWMEATFQDLDANTVRLTITAPNLVNKE